MPAAAMRSAAPSSIRFSFCSRARITHVVNVRCTLSMCERHGLGGISIGLYLACAPFATCGQQQDLVRMQRNVFYSYQMTINNAKLNIEIQTCSKIQ